MAFGPEDDVCERSVVWGSDPGALMHRSLPMTWIYLGPSIDILPRTEYLSYPSSHENLLLVHNAIVRCRDLPHRSRYPALVGI